MKYLNLQSHLLVAGLSFLGASLSIASAATANASFDFGTDIGKVSSVAAGFTVDVPETGAAEDVADALRLTAGTQGFTNLSFLQGFVGMNAADAHDFIIATKTSVHSFASSNNRRWGIHLFAGSNLQKDGICALINGNNKEGNRQIIFREGLDGKNLASAVFASGGFTQGDVYTFSLTGNYVGEKDLNLSLTVSDGLNTSTVTTTVDRSQYPGTLTGASARVRQGWAIDFHNFSITIP